MKMETRVIGGMKEVMRKDGEIYKVTIALGAGELRVLAVAVGEEELVEQCVLEEVDCLEEVEQTSLLTF